MSNLVEVERKATPGHGTPQAPVRQDTAAKSRRWKRGRRALLFGLLALVLLIPGSVSVYLYSLAQVYESHTVKLENAFPPEAVRVQAPEVPAGVPTPMNILVMGSDSRDKSDAAAAQAAAGTASDQRADTLMLVHIPADRAHIYSISLMRDLWINIPDYGESKINAALAYGGVPLVVQTVESLLQQRIDQVVRIDFEGFKGLVDALGGVKVDVKVPFTAARATSHYVFKEGLNTLSGAKALAFVRERYAFPDGDYQRVRNQQSFLKAVVTKIFDGGALRNPTTLQNLLSVMSPYLSVAPVLDPVEVGRLAFSLRDIQSKDTVAFTLPTAGVGTSADGQSIVLPDLAAIEEIKAALTEDRLGDYAAAKSLGDGN